MKKAIDMVFTLIMVVVIIFAFLLVGVRLFGLTPYTVISGSMEPEYPVGSLIYVKKVTANEIKVGDPITYILENGAVVTHRVVEVLVDEDNPTVVRFRTKGDANKDADGTPVHINNVLGKPIFKIPGLGYVTYYVQHPPGSYIIVGILGVLLLLSFLPGLLGSNDNGSEQTAEEIDETKELVNELKAMREELAKRQEAQNNGSTSQSTKESEIDKNKN